MKKIFTVLFVVFFMCFSMANFAFAANKDTIIFAPDRDARVLDPHDSTDNTTSQVNKMIYNTMLEFDLDLNIVPGLAMEWKASKDGLTWTFKLRKGVAFQDGTPLDAEVVKKSFTRVTDKVLGLNRRGLFQMITKIDVIDKYTIAFTTDKPTGIFPAMMAHPGGGVVNPKYSEKFPGKKLGQKVESICGSGPYKVVKWSRDEEIILERSENYWGEKPLTKRIIYRVIPEAEARVIALETGEIDVMQKIPAPDMPRLEKIKGISVIKVKSNGQRQFRFNLAKPPFDNILVRKAVSYAIDRKIILDNVLTGLGSLSVSALSPVTWGAADLGVRPYLPDMAKELLALAGYPDGFKCKLTTTARYTMGVEMAEVIAAQLKKVGITAEIEVLEWGTFVQELRGKTPDTCKLGGIFIMGAGPSTGDADWGLRPIYHTAPTNIQNYGFYSNKEFDILVTKGLYGTDQEIRKVLYKRAQEIVYIEDPVAFWIHDNYFIIGAQDSVKDLTISPLGFVTFEKAYKEK